MTFNDPRRFGSMKIVPRRELDAEPLLKNLGPEPLGNAFDAAMLASACRGKKTSLKAALSDQRVVAGLGNIYVCEALYRARLSPKRMASTIATPTGAPNERAERLVEGIKAVLNDAIKAGGSSLRDHKLHRRRTRHVPASLPRLRPRRRKMPDARLPRHRQAHRAEWALDVLLSGMPKVMPGKAAPGAAMSYETIIVETRGKVGLIRLNRPQALNALNSALERELEAALDAFEADAAIGCMVITGSDKAFAAGADIKEMADKSFAEAFLGEFVSSWDRVAHMRKPVIAAVAGFALGGGCELAMQCDLIIAADNAKFGQPEIKLGVIPGIGGTQRLTRAVGKAKAMDLILTGRMMDAQEAERSGLVARIVPLASLVEEAVKIAETIASMSLPSVLAAKEAVNRAFETSLAEGVRFERRVFHSLFATADQKEGMAAFIAKRPPKFENK